MPETASRQRDFAWIVVAYVAAAAVAIATVLTMASMGYNSLLWQAVMADITATLCIYAFSVGFRNSSFYDAYWSVIPPVLLAFWIWGYDAWNAVTFGVWLITLLWAVRLTWNWARGWQGLHHVDWRYVDLRANTGVFFPVVDLFGIHLLPTGWVFLGCLPVWYLVQSPQVALSAVDLIWVVIGLGSVYLEFRADNVLRAFRLDQSNAGQVLQVDVWQYCRHPNYLGELGFWLALAIAGYLHSGDPMAWLGFASIVILFVFISIPMIDKRQLASKPGYAAYRERVPSLIPRPPRTK